MGDRDSVLLVIAQLARFSWSLEPKDGDTLRTLVCQAKVEWERYRAERSKRHTVLTMSGETGEDDCPPVYGWFPETCLAPTPEAP